MFDGRARWAAGGTSRNFTPSLAATAGDDYELLFTAPESARENVEAAASGAGAPVRWLGRVSAGTGLRLLGADGAAVDLSGYEHV